MELKTYVSIRTSTYEEQQAVLAEFPDAFFIQRGEMIFDFFLPSFKINEMDAFVKEWKQNLKEKKGET